MKGIIKKITRRHKGGEYYSHKIEYDSSIPSVPPYIDERKIICTYLTNTYGFNTITNYPHFDPTKPWAYETTTYTKSYILVTEAVLTFILLKFDT